MPPTPKYFQLAMSPAVASQTKTPDAKYPKPLLRLELRDLSLKGTHIFLHNVDASDALRSAVSTVLRLLYPATSNAHIPPTRSITLVLRSMSGVAYTTGKDIDDDHKEIHLSCEYLDHVASDRKHDEIMGVLVHEVVHCWQWNALGTAPGGLIEGIADWVRLRADLGPPHWKKEKGGDWDAGYQHTGYFLDWIETKYGPGSVVSINETLRDCKYDESQLWKKLFKADVKDLWEEYSKTLPDETVEQDKSNSHVNEDVVQDVSQSKETSESGKSPMDIAKEIPHVPISSASRE
jgi:hypothetical protein